MTNLSARESVVLFDFGGTLDADGLRWSVRFHARYRAAGGTLDLATFEPLFQRSDEMLAALPGIRSLEYRATVDAQARLLGRLLPDARAVSLGALAEAFYREARATIERNRPLLERLAARHRLGLISNFTGNLAPCLEELDLVRFFDVVLDSALEGIEKPEAGLFTRALGALGVLPADAWMVGDNFEADIRPALGLGMRACWLTPAHLAAPPGGDASARIACLLDLVRVLETGPMASAAARGMT